MTKNLGAVQYAIDRELKLVSTVKDTNARESLEAAVYQRYEDRVAQIRHDTRQSPMTPTEQ